MTKNMPFGIKWYKTLGSTNDEARRLLQESPAVQAVAAVDQTCGRGQGGNTWHSSPENSLTFSISVRFPELFPMAASDFLDITRVTTLSILAYLSEKDVEARIKWPNDIWVGDRKICGILIENIVRGQYLDASIIGIGLNLNDDSFPEWLPNPISLHQVSGETYSRETELELLCRQFSRHLSMLKDDDGCRYLKDAFEEKVFRLCASGR